MNLLVKDVLEALVIERDETGVINKALFFGATTESSISHDLPVEKLRAGIHNRVMALSFGDREVTFSVTTLLKNADLDALRYGQSLENSTMKVATPVKYVLKTGGKILGTDLNGATLENVIVLDNEKNIPLETTESDTDLLVTGKVAGDEVIIVYEQEVTGDIVKYGSKDFPKPKEIHLHTIAYNPENEKVVADIYYVFKRALPSGTFEETFASSPNSDEIQFEALEDADGMHGYKIIVARE